MNDRPADDRARGVQFELGPEMAGLVDSLKARTHASTRAEVLRRALSVFDLLQKEQEAGARIEVVEPSGERSRLRIV